MKTVKLLDLAPCHEPIRDEIDAAIDQVISSNRYILGTDVESLETRVAAYSDCQFGIGVTSGTDALLVALTALDVGPGDEVITSAYTFFATAGVIARLGATPVFVDIDPVSFNLDPAHLSAALSTRTRAIIPVHLFGQCADMEPILDFAAANGLAVIEDAAQAQGARYKNGYRAGSMGVIGCLSFFPTKNLGAMGDGGMIVTNDEALAEKMRILRVHGGHPKYVHAVVGGNFRLDALQAAILNVKLNYLDGWLQQRQENADRYRALFAAANLPETAVIVPRAQYGDSGVSNCHTWNQFNLQAADRDALRDHLASQGIDAEIYYPIPLPMQACFKDLGYTADQFPRATTAAEASLAIPVYPGLQPAQQEYVVEQISAFYAR